MGNTLPFLAPTTPMKSVWPSTVRIACLFWTAFWIEAATFLLSASVIATAWTFGRIDCTAVGIGIESSKLPLLSSFAPWPLLLAAAIGSSGYPWTVPEGGVAGLVSLEVVVVEPSLPLLKTPAIA